MTISLPSVLLGAGIAGAVAYLIMRYVYPNEPVKEAAWPYPPLATNVYVPDPSINEWSYQNAIRKDYEALERLAMGDARNAVGWPISNLHPTYEDYLNTKYGFF